MPYRILIAKNNAIPSSFFLACIELFCLPKNTSVIIQQFKLTKQEARSTIDAWPVLHVADLRCSQTHDLCMSLDPYHALLTSEAFEQNKEGYAHFIFKIPVVQAGLSIQWAGRFHLY